MNLSAAGEVPAASNRFYLLTAVIGVLVAFGGFIPTYWAKMATGTFNGRAIIHVHGMLMLAWMLFYLMQTLFVATRRTSHHRAWGLAGISLVTAAVISVPLVTINAMNVGDAAGFGDAARRFSIVPLSMDVLFPAFMVAAIVNIRDPQAHKRWMVMATVPLLGAAVARLFFTYLAPPGALGPPPVVVTLLPRMLPDLIIVAGMIIDWRTRGRVHMVYLIGLPILLVAQIAIGPFSTTPTWMAIASWMQALPG